jgi:hypothetical protein
VTIVDVLHVGSGRHAIDLTSKVDADPVSSTRRLESYEGKGCLSAHRR